MINRVSPALEQDPGQLRQDIQTGNLFQAFG